MPQPLCNRLAPPPRPILPSFKATAAHAREGIIPGQGRAEAQVAGLDANCLLHGIKGPNAQHSQGAGPSPGAGVSMSPRWGRGPPGHLARILGGSKTDVCLWESLFVPFLVPAKDLQAYHPQRWDKAQCSKGGHGVEWYAGMRSGGTKALGLTEEEASHPPIPLGFPRSHRPPPVS